MKFVDEVALVTCVTKACVLGHNTGVGDAVSGEMFGQRNAGKAGTGQMPARLVPKRDSGNRVGSISVTRECFTAVMHVTVQAMANVLYEVKDFFELLQGTSEL